MMASFAADLDHVQLRQLPELVEELRLKQKEAMERMDAMERKFDAAMKEVSPRLDQLEAEHAELIAAHRELRQGYIALVQSLHHASKQYSFITRFPIRRSGALQQAFYGSPPTCPVL